MKVCDTPGVLIFDGSACLMVGWTFDAEGAPMPASASSEVIVRQCLDAVLAFLGQRNGQANERVDLAAEREAISAINAARRPA